MLARDHNSFSYCNHIVGVSGGSSVKGAHRTGSRQSSSSGRHMSQSGDGKMRRRSGNSPSASLPSFSPLPGGPLGQPMQVSELQPLTTNIIGGLF